MAKNNFRGVLKTPDGKKLPTPEDFIKRQAPDPVCMVFIYNREERMVMEALKNMRTKRTHILKVRRPKGTVEEKEFDAMIMREKLAGRENQNQIEVIMGGDEYVKKVLKSQGAKK